MAFFGGIDGRRSDDGWFEGKENNLPVPSEFYTQHQNKRLSSE